MVLTLVNEENKFHFFEELQIVLEKRKATKEIDTANLLRTVWTSTQNFDPNDKSKPKAFNGFAIFKEWIEERIRLVKKLSKELTFFEKEKLKSEGFEYFKKKKTVKETTVVRGQTFVNYKEVN